MSLLSENEGKRAVERAWIVYTPIWGAITGVVMLLGFAERWGDFALMAFGVVLALGALVAPLVNLPASERALPIHARTSTRMSVAIVLLAFGLNYFQTPYFFDVLHMRYGFHATWTLDRNPLFLYLVTIPYFATYSVLACVAMRAARRYGARWPGPLRLVPVAIVPFALAFLETVLNANPWMTALFCYDDLALMLWFGTLSYGVSFVLALPAWMAVDERPGQATPLARVVAMTLLVVALDTAALFALRETVAPHLTNVIDHASGGAGGCLGEGVRSGTDT
jgi:cycloeucalenol cycloisomerase